MVMARQRRLRTPAGSAATSPVVISGIAPSRRADTLTKTVKIVALLTLALSARAAWFVVFRHDQREIRSQLSALITEFNGASVELTDATMRAGRIGHYFTRDVIIEFGKGRSAVQGRETLVDMATRLLPRISAFAAALADADIQVLDPSRADVTVTLVTQHRASDSQDFDPCELSISFRNMDGAWRIGHVKLVDPFR